MAVELVSIITGFIVGMLALPYLDKYLLTVLAIVGAIALGIVVYMLMKELLLNALN